MSDSLMIGFMVAGIYAFLYPLQQYRKIIGSRALNRANAKRALANYPFIVGDNKKVFDLLKKEMESFYKVTIGNYKRVEIVSTYGEIEHKFYFKSLTPDKYIGNILISIPKEIKLEIGKKYKIIGLYNNKKLYVESIDDKNILNKN